MASTYVNDLRLNEMATGDASGTWGTITNTNLELIGEALGYATQDCFASDADATTTVADGATDPARAMYFKVTSSATLTATRTLTIAPNTVSRLQFIENATTGSQSINISQGSGANVTIPSGQTKAVYFDGAGSGAAVTDSFASLNLNLKDNVKLNFGDADDLQIYHNGTDSKIYDGGTGNLTLESNGTQIELKSTTGDMVRAVKDDEVVLFYSGSRKLATTNTGIEVTGNIANASGDLTLDVAGDFTLDVGGGDIAIKDDGTEFGRMVNSSTDFVIQSSVNDRDLIFKGKDNNAVITALTLDMSDAGSAYFNNDLYIPNYIYHTGDTNTYIHFPAGDNFQVVTAGFSRMKMVGSETVFNEDSADVDFRVESDGNTHAIFVEGSSNNVGIGNSDPTTTVTKFGGSAQGLAVKAGQPVIAVEDTSNAQYVAYLGQSETHSYLGAIGGGDLQFQTGTSGTSKQRITSTGSLVANGVSASTQSAGAEGHFVSLNDGAKYGMISGCDNVANRDAIVFTNPNGLVGTIKTNGSSTSYNTSSDYRLKENVSYSIDATSRLKQLKPARFNFIADANTTVDGFLAHEVSSIVPEAISGTKDETKDIGTIKDKDGVVVNENVFESAKEDGQTWEKTGTKNIYQNIDQAKLVPLLVKTIQELEARITTLENA